jgi:predicted glycoside hydrolase/deacetylase ChbG (UPF0249 family)
MSIKKQIKKLEHYDVHQRSHFEKIGAVVLTAATVLSIVIENHDATKRMAKTDVIANPNFVSVNAEPAEKNEMVRSPIKFDDGLRAAATTGA